MGLCRAKLMSGLGFITQTHVWLFAQRDTFQVSLMFIFSYLRKRTLSASMTLQSSTENVIKFFFYNRDLCVKKDGSRGFVIILERGYCPLAPAPMPLLSAFY